MMKNYHQLLHRVMLSGEHQFNTRTGKACRAIVGAQLQFDLRAGFPAITTKKLAFNAMKGELLGFFRGYTSAADFRALGCGVWDANANTTAAWLANPARSGLDSLGAIYGKQWVAWTDRRIAGTATERDRLAALGYVLRMVGETVTEDGKRYEYLMEHSINQLEGALRKLITDPSDRRIIVSGWNVAELDLMALPPCHMDYRFVAFDGPTPEAPKMLHVVMTIRSWDLFLGAPFNISEVALFLSIMARMAGMVPGVVTVQATNCHVYEDHFDQAYELLTRKPFPAPRLVLSENIRAVALDDIPGAFQRIEPDDIQLEGYQSHAAIKAPMAA